MARMRKFTIGCMVIHPGYPLARFIMLDFDLDTEVCHFYNRLDREVKEFHFTDLDDCKIVKPGNLDSLLS